MVACALVACRTVEAQPGTATVVLAGEHRITVSEFDEFARHLAGEAPLPWGEVEARRQKVLEAFLAREVLLLEAEARGALRSGELEGALERRERELVVEQLYEREVTERARPTEKQLDSLYEARDAGEAVRARHILCSTEEEARAVLGELAAGADFAALARTRSRHSQSAVAGGDMGYLRREQLLPEMRDLVWQARPGQLLPAPVRTRMGYHVIEVTDHRRRTREEMRAELGGEVRRALQRQREAALGAELRSRYHFRWDPVVAAAVVDAPGQPIATWDGGALSVEQFVEHCRQQGRRPADLDTAEARELGQAAALRGLLWCAGRDTRLGESDPAVARGLHQARLELAAGALYKEVAAAVEVSPAALRQAYEEDPSKYRQSPVLRIQEILVDDLDLADSLAALVRGGADMAALATRHSRRVWAAAKGGDLGDIAEGMPAYTKLARVMREAPVGELVGPVPSHGGYSLLRVTSRQEGEVVPFEEARPAVANSLCDHAMDAYIDSLRGVYATRIEVDPGGLEQTLGGMTQ